jgi:hypothetical protein
MLSLMAKWKGFTERLQTPADLLRKLEHDYSRLGEAPSDPYVAFDFFVTADAFIDWRWPGDSLASHRSTVRSTEPMKTAYHLSSGAKHFEATHRRHDSVRDLQTRRGAFQGWTNLPDALRADEAFQPFAFDTGDLLVLRDSGEIAAFTLAAEVLEWARAAL